jgi:hypothetical protein
MGFIGKKEALAYTSARCAQMRLPCENYLYKITAKFLMEQHMDHTNTPYRTAL